MKNSVYDISCMLTMHHYNISHDHVDEYIISGVDIHYFHNFCVIFHVPYMNVPTQYHKSHENTDT